MQFQDIGDTLARGGAVRRGTVDALADHPNERCTPRVCDQVPARPRHFPRMLTKTPKRSKRTLVPARPQSRSHPEMFWVRAGHPDLDRAGDLLLRHLAEIRQEAPSGSPR